MDRLILLLDTHVFLWQILGDRRLGEKQRLIIANPANTIHLSAVSIFEMSIKAGIGKLGLPQRYKNDLTLIFQDFNFQSLSITIHHANSAGRLIGAHRDPFDRLLAAQSIVENIPIMTVDSKLRELGAEVVW
jgi:PIN domain nuclease of toxin-antitoxin system